ncbi:hypothetical protein Aperf_G00000032486 [Anoplocephala perfoliata]
MVFTFGPLQSNGGSWGPVTHLADLILRDRGNEVAHLRSATSMLPVIFLLSILLRSPAMDIKVVPLVFFELTHRRAFSRVNELAPTIDLYQEQAIHGNECQSKRRQLCFEGLPLLATGEVLTHSSAETRIHIDSSTVGVMDVTTEMERTVVKSFSYFIDEDFRLPKILLSVEGVHTYEFR